MTGAAQCRELEAAADALLARHRGRVARQRTVEQKRRRIEREQGLSEAEGRAAFARYQGTVRPAFDDHGQPILTFDGRDDEGDREFDAPGPLPVEAGADVLNFALFGGRATPGAIVSRVVGLAVASGIITASEAARISGKSARTISRNVTSKTPAKAHEY